MQAFQNCTALASITLPDKVKSIRMAAFQNCTDLVSIDLPDKVETIEQLAFQGCTKLASVISLNTTPPTLGTNAFDGTSLLTSIKVPSTSVTTYQSAWSAYSGKITALP
jgi:hypothetical protein